MQNIVGKIDGKVIKIKTLTAADIEKINAKAKIERLDDKPVSTDSLQSNTFYIYPSQMTK